jgi:DNA-binding NtrC family response regulator
MDLILLVDSDLHFLRLLRSILIVEGHRVETATSAGEAFDTGEKFWFHLVISNDAEVLSWFKKCSPDTAVLSSVRKPLASAHEVRSTARRALERREFEWLRQESRQICSFNCLIAEDPKMSKPLTRARKAAASGASVLLRGERGTGKELLARCIHSESPRRNRTFTVVDCSARPLEEIETELFGGDDSGPGRLERANGGTLYLKEVARLDARLQGKLLRAVHNKTFERSGSNRIAMSDARVIASNTRGMKERLDAGSFEQSAYSIALPPLRERRLDIPALATRFLSRAKPELSITPETLERLSAYDWPGNLDELKLLMERAAMLCDRVVTVDHLPALERRIEVQPARTMLEIERRAIEEAIGANSGNRIKAAAQLGISLRTIQYRIRQYGLQERSKRL